MTRETKERKKAKERAEQVEEALCFGVYSAAVAALKGGISCENLHSVVGLAERDYRHDGIVVSAFEYHEFRGNNDRSARKNETR